MTEYDQICPPSLSTGPSRTPLAEHGERSGTDGTAQGLETPAGSPHDPGEPPSVHNILDARAPQLRQWSEQNGLNSSLKKPLLQINLCALWHPEELPRVITQLRLTQYQDEVHSILQGQLMCSPDRPTPLSRQAQIDELRRRHCALPCEHGELCNKYRHEQAAALECLATLEQGSKDAGQADLSPALPQLPVTPAECHEILQAIVRAERRAATPVQRLTSNLFAVLRTDAASVENSYSTPEGYSLVKMTVTPCQESSGLSLKYHCNCTQFRVCFLLIEPVL